MNKSYTQIFQLNFKIISIAFTLTKIKISNVKFLFNKTNFNKIFSQSNVLNMNLNI